MFFLFGTLHENRRNKIIYLCYFFFILEEGKVVVAQQTSNISGTYSNVILSSFKPSNILVTEKDTTTTPHLQAMCIISGHVKNVSNTKILVAPLTQSSLNDDSKASSLQLTVYCNKVSVKDKNAVMVLPFPKSEYKSFDLTEYPTLFDDLSKIWPQARSLSRSSATYSLSNSNSLEVFQNGSYSASVVPDIDDFSRLQGQVFEVNQDVISFMKEHYPSGYSFVVCKLDGNKEYHPFAYIHSTLPGGAMFIPTMHYHTHDTPDIKFRVKEGVYQQQIFLHKMDGKDDENVDQPFFTPSSSTSSSSFAPFPSPSPSPSPSPPKTTKQITADWNHEIYCWNRPLAQVPDEFQSIQQKCKPHHFQLTHLPDNIEAADMVFGYKIRNYKNNHDLICAAE